MIVYAVILLSAAALCFAFGLAIYRGKTDLIHDYHQTNIPEEKKPAYGKAVAKGLFVLCASLAAGGITSLIADSKAAMRLSTGILFAGIAISIVMLVRTQYKYNGSVL